MKKNKSKYSQYLELENQKALTINLLNSISVPNFDTNDTDMFLVLVKDKNVYPLLVNFLDNNDVKFIAYKMDFNKGSCVEIPSPFTNMNDLAGHYSFGYLNKNQILFGELNETGDFFTNFKILSANGDEITFETIHINVNNFDKGLISNPVQDSKNKNIFYFSYTEEDAIYKLDLYNKTLESLGVNLKTLKETSPIKGDFMNLSYMKDGCIHTVYRYEGFCIIYAYDSGLENFVEVARYLDTSCKYTDEVARSNNFLIFESNIAQDYIPTRFVDLNNYKMYNIHPNFEHHTIYGINALFCGSNNKIDGTLTTTNSLIYFVEFDDENKLIEQTSKNTVLELTEDKFQYATFSDGDSILLPNVSSFTEIHLFFKTTSEISLILPSDIRWQTQPSIQANKVYELIFTYIINEWVGRVVEYF